MTLLLLNILFINFYRIYNYGEGDDNSSLEDDFNEWKTNLWKSLQDILPK
jgi:uncharacterized protein HemX